ncbi:M24 family metallopeptidase [Salinicola rhizosphaerae]|uniref:Peptidase n=1 Tax=Salinicola rhizosphaerae TaxID=1443141 RepID=A0ABQ3DSQ0_9GAMM|nr:Xaa-Pro peptidase family protein [Salinicola rhizosphaerae]GHB14577.1 peptidase [Salinicola rhizosphaerae]
MTDSSQLSRRGREAVFSRDVFESRIEAARALMAERAIDDLIVTGPENIFYLTGQQTPGYYTFQALLLPVDGEPRFIVRGLEEMNFRANTFLEGIEAYDDGTDPLALLVDLVGRGGANRRIAIDKRGWFLPIATYDLLRDKLGELKDGAGLVETLRAVKSADEIACLERAAGYVDAGMAAGMAAVRAGASENDLVAAMMEAAIRAGSEYLGMEPLVSSGERTGVPHGTWRRRKLAAGEPAFLEMAASHNRYHAVAMRSAWLGTPPDRARRMMDTCQEALDAALAALKPGNTCADAHNAAQRVIDRDGFTDNYRKRTGYSVGISFAPDWGEFQVASLYANVDRVLEPGMVFHIPPALRDYGVFTVGVSETVVVTADGHRVLGRTPRDMQIVGA